MFFDRKGAPELLWGLLILFTANPCLADGFGIGGRGGILYYTDAGQIRFWDGAASYRRGSIFENELNFLRVNSTMPRLSADVSAIGYSAGMDFGMVKPEAAGGLITSSGVESIFGKYRILNSGADGFWTGSSLGFGVGRVEVTPSFLFARVKFGRGDFYKFYGRPDVPGLIHFGLSAEWEKTHRAGITYEKLDLDILNNRAVTLFQSNNYCIGMNYRYSLPVPQKPWDFQVISGLNYAEMSANGALTAANQQYALFPYAFYRLSGDADAVAGWAMLSLDIRGKFLEHSIKAGAGNIFGGRMYANAHYQYRKSFGDEEVNEDIIDTGLSGTGIAFSAYSLESRGLAAAENVHVYLGLSKIIGYYWGMGKFKISEKEEDNKKKINYRGLAKTAALSGLSGNIKVLF